MRSYHAAALSVLACIASAEQMFDLADETLPLRSSVSKSLFGAIVEEVVWAEDSTETTVTFPALPFSKDPVQIADFYNRMADKAESNTEPIYTCDDRDLNPVDDTFFWEFMPVYVAALSPTNANASYGPGKCFSSIDFEFAETTKTQYIVKVTLGGKKNLTCVEEMIFGDTEAVHAQIFVAPGSHVVKFNMPTEQEQKDIGFGGLHVWLSCQGALGQIESILRTLNLLVSESIGLDEASEKAVKNFAEKAMNVQYVEREHQQLNLIPAHLIKSGDFFGSSRTDGMDACIRYGTGAVFSHTLQALWFDDGLYIVESTGPVIKRTPYVEKMQRRFDGGFEFVWLPLTEEARAKYDEEAARKFFFEHEGLPYGYENFLYGWIDTERSNLPILLPNELLPIVFMVAEKLSPYWADRVFGAGLNKRLGTNGLKIADLAAEAADQGMTLEQVMAIPETDGWQYEKGPAYVCSAFCTALWKAAGLFDGVEINTTEVTPYDVMLFSFLETDADKRPQSCKDNDPDLPYCQLMGKYEVRIPDSKYGYLEPYDHMLEKCETITPFYEHSPVGC